METLSQSQFRNLVILIKEQLKGRTLLFGCRYDYNDKTVYSASLKAGTNRNGTHVMFHDVRELGDGRFKKSIERFLKYTFVTTQHSEFYNAVALDYQLIMNYKNGPELYSQAANEISQEEKVIFLSKEQIIGIRQFLKSEFDEENVNTIILASIQSFSSKRNNTDESRFIVRGHDYDLDVLIDAINDGKIKSNNSMDYLINEYLKKL